MKTAGVIEYTADMNFRQDGYFWLVVVKPLATLYMRYGDLTRVVARFLLPENFGEGTKTAYLSQIDSIIKDDLGIPVYDVAKVNCTSLDFKACFDGGKWTLHMFNVLVASGDIITEDQTFTDINAATRNLVGFIPA